MSSRTFTTLFWPNSISVTEKLASLSQMKNIVISVSDEAALIQKFLPPCALVRARIVGKVSLKASRSAVFWKLKNCPMMIRPWHMDGNGAAAADAGSERVSVVVIVVVPAAPVEVTVVVVVGMVLLVVGGARGGGAVCVCLSAGSELGSARHEPIFFFFPVRCGGTFSRRCAGIVAAA